MRYFTFFLLLLAFFFPSKAFASDVWTIDKFNSAITVQQSGEVHVVETINVDFGYQQKHGIYRDIPYIYENNGEKTYTEITIEDIQQNDKKATYETLRENGYLRLKIGDANKTISGKNSYVLTYTAKGILRSFADYDELYWNVTGNGWPVPITQAEAIVKLPKEGIKKISCYEGNTGSQTLCQYTQDSPQLARFGATQPLTETQGLTIAIGYTKGIVPILTVERPKEFWEKLIEWPSLLTLIATFFAGVWLTFFLWNKHGRDNWFAQNIFGKPEEVGIKKPIGAHETITVEFTSPEKLRPAEIGVLIDERADTHDVVATIIDLATRGFLTIREIPKKGLFGSVDYELTKTEKDTADLLKYEKLLYNSLFPGWKSVKLSSLKNTFYTKLSAVKDEMYKEAVTKKLFVADPQTDRRKYYGIAAAVLVGSSILAIFSSIGDFVFGTDIGIAGSLTGIILLTMAKFMPRRTAYGRELYRRTKGYHLFIDKAEKYRQQFFERQNMFNEVLPYAIVFGIAEKFAKQMREIGVEQTQTSWYVGTHPITSAQFGSSLNNFSNSLSTTMASTPSSSGSSGGGSSGGGFGGGGGGSW